MWGGSAISREVRHTHLRFLSLNVCLPHAQNHNTSILFWKARLVAAFKKGRRHYYQLILELNPKEKPKPGSQNCCRHVEKKTSEQIPGRLSETDARWQRGGVKTLLVFPFGVKWFCTDGMNFSKILPDDSRWLTTTKRKIGSWGEGRHLKNMFSVIVGEFSGQLLRRR